MNSLYQCVVHVQVASENPDGRYGTAFFLSMPVNGCTKFFLVSNRHVLYPLHEIVIFMHDGSKYRFLRLGTITYSEEELDIACIPMSPIRYESPELWERLPDISFPSSDILDLSQLHELPDFAEVISIAMPGYFYRGDNPCLPIARQGILSMPAHYCDEYILLDIHCYPRCSGSPVFTFIDGLPKMMAIEKSGATPTGYNQRHSQISIALPAYRIIQLIQRNI